MQTLFLEGLQLKKHLQLFNDIYLLQNGEFYHALLEAIEPLFSKPTLNSDNVQRGKRQTNPRYMPLLVTIPIQNSIQYFKQLEGSCSLITVYSRNFVYHLIVVQGQTAILGLT